MQFINSLTAALVAFKSVNIVYDRHAAALTSSSGVVSAMPTAIADGAEVAEVAKVAEVAEVANNANVADPPRNYGGSGYGSSGYGSSGYGTSSYGTSSYGTASYGSDYNGGSDYGDRFDPSRGDRDYGSERRGKKLDDSFCKKYGSEKDECKERVKKCDKKTADFSEDERKCREKVERHFEDEKRKGNNRGY